MGILQKIGLKKDNEAPPWQNTEYNKGLDQQQPAEASPGITTPPSDAGVTSMPENNLGQPQGQQYQEPMQNGGAAQSQAPMQNQDQMNAPAGMQSPFNANSFQERNNYEASRQSQGFEHKEFETINAKLDTIRAVLDNLAMRVQKIEKIASEEQENSKKDQWY